MSIYWSAGFERSGSGNDSGVIMAIAMADASVISQVVTTVGAGKGMIEAKGWQK